MRKLLTLTLALATLGFGALPVAAAPATAAISPASGAASSAVEPQWRRRQQRRQTRRGRNNSRVRTVTQTRIVRYGRQVYRETYQIRYLPNGRTQTRLIRRVRIR